MLNGLRTALRTTEGKLKIVILLSGTLILFLALTAAALELTSTPTFCSMCHEMRPEYYTWEASAHNKIACVDCHVKPGIKNFVEHKIESMQQVYLHFTGTYVTPIQISEPVSNSTCEQCHNMDNRPTTPAGDIKFPHTTHLKQGVQCIQCHSGVVHGNIEENGYTALTNFNKWNLTVGNAYIQATLQPKMSDCIQCHQQNGAPVTCDTCHTKIVKPANHTQESWLTQHGHQAEKDFAACNKCHANTFSYGTTIPAGMTVAQYARANTFCFNCHQQKPASHTNSQWRKIHATIASKDKTDCMVCHDEVNKSIDNPPASVDCMQCHREQHQPHTYPTFHPVPIPPSGLGPECIGCHNPSICENCHAPVN